MRKYILLIMLLCTVGCSCLGQSRSSTRIRDLVTLVGSNVTVEGRSGIIEEKYERAGVKAFTLRDSYGSMIVIRSREPEYPIMGITLTITGQVSREERVLFLDANTIYSTYAPPVNRWKMIAEMGGVVLVGLGILWFLLRPQPIWGHLIVTQGTDKSPARELPLRGKRIELGRDADPRKGLRILQEDHSIHRSHGVILQRDGQVFYENRVNGGSQVNKKVLTEGEQVALKPGTIIFVGSLNSRLEYRPLGVRVNRDVTIVDPHLAILQEAETEKDLPGGEANSNPKGKTRSRISR
jgi:hypothetical protein